MSPLLAALLVTLAQLQPALQSDAPHQQHASRTPAELHLRLDELLLLNASVQPDSAGEFDAWVELVNTATVPVDAGGLHLSDDPSTPDRWRLPDGLFVPARGRRLVWLDGQPAQGVDHADLQPDPLGGVLLLVAADGHTELDRVPYGEQLTDVSMARLGRPPVPDQWFSLLDPTPGETSLGPGGSVRRYKASDPAKNLISFRALGPAVLGQTTTFQVEDGVVGELVFFYVATNPRHLALPGGSSVLLVDLQFPTVPFALDAEGSTSFDVVIPGNPAYAGLPVYTQVLHPISHYPGSNAVVLTLALP